ncbi:methyltransferase family protein [Stackebrandtia albiflava]|uniref:Methyltransferase family protein n=1 Tax=Stackebrandtia albiflava TaxID=406432 RepID=A0A562VB26_9ACTN|nr:class I SAM-dependent methyltransferase [Stackebrandtia albiflava]TWJ15076.1 methyltransferase family protein [Stackebrandtia albiflava]
MTSPFTARRPLRERAYPDPSNLETRRAVYRFRRPPLDLVGEVAARLATAPPGTLLDVGSGSGVHTRALRDRHPDRTVIGLDLSHGMAGHTGPPAVVADAEALPVADGVVAGCLAVHMLYHVPRPRLAVAELARVLTDDGLVVIVAQDGGDRAEVEGLWRDCVHATGGEWRRESPLDLSGMAVLAADHFESVTRHDFPGETVVPDWRPVVAYQESTRALSGLSDAGFDAAMAEFTARVRSEVARTGVFRFTNRVGILTARRPLRS